jgi:hypothetical protein
MMNKPHRSLFSTFLRMPCQPEKEKIMQFIFMLITNKRKWARERVRQLNLLAI